MACLALGIPVVTTSGHLTESLWAESEAVALADVTDAERFAAKAIELIADLIRPRLGQHGQRVYREHFDIARSSVR